MTYTITKIRCTSCDGSGSMLGLPGIGYMWCQGTGRLSRDDALRHARLGYALAGGGYIAGDYSLDEMRAEEAQAEAVYALFRETPPWRKSPEPSYGR